MKKLALFDFDHSLISADSFLEFLYYCFPKWKVRALLLCYSPILIFKGKSFYKEWFFKKLFKNWDNESILKFANSFVYFQLGGLLNNEVYSELKKRQTDSHVIIVSASFDLWLEPWCKKEGVGLICTRFNLQKRAIDGANCKGEEKAKRIKTELDLKKFEHIFALGNLPEDKAMFSLADDYKVIKA